MEDRDLVAKAQRGDVDAYNVLISRWDRRVFQYLVKLVGHREDAMDLSQEVFLKAWQALGKLDDAGRFSPWLFRIAHNEAFSMLRRLRPQEELQERAVGDLSTGRMYPAEVSLAVGRAMERLTPEQRETVILKVHQGFKFDEIAEILDTPVSTVKSRLYTGLELLKQALAPVNG